MTYDYQFEWFGEVKEECHCGAEGCRGVMGTAMCRPRLAGDWAAGRGGNGQRAAAVGGATKARRRKQ